MRRLILFSDKKQTLFIGKTPHKAVPGGVRLEPAGISGAVEDLPPELGQLHPAAVGDTDGADPGKAAFFLQAVRKRAEPPVLRRGAVPADPDRAPLRYPGLLEEGKIRPQNASPSGGGAERSEAEGDKVGGAVVSPSDTASPCQLPQRGSHPLRQTMNKSPAVTPKKFAP